MKRPINFRTDVAQGSNGIRWNIPIQGNYFVLCISIYRCDLCLHLGEHAHVRSIQKLEVNFPSRDVTNTFRKTKVVLTDAFLHAPSAQFKLRLADGFKSFSCPDRVRILEVQIFGMSWKHKSSRCPPHLEGPSNDYIYD